VQGEREVGVACVCTDCAEPVDRPLSPRGGAAWGGQMGEGATAGEVREGRGGGPTQTGKERNDETLGATMLEGSPGKTTSPEPSINSLIDGDLEVRSTNQT
jgi:hypothetical protein